MRYVLSFVLAVSSVLVNTGLAMHPQSPAGQHASRSDFDIAYVVLRETITFKSPKNGKPTVQELRVTQIFRREGEAWLIVHRHADSQVTKETTG